jgi:hypothetical protein
VRWTCPRTPGRWQRERPVETVHKDEADGPSSLQTIVSISSGLRPVSALAQPRMAAPSSIQICKDRKSTDAIDCISWIERPISSSASAPTASSMARASARLATKGSVTLRCYSARPFPDRRCSGSPGRSAATACEVLLGVMQGQKLPHFPGMPYSTQVPSDQRNAVIKPRERIEDDREAHDLGEPDSPPA